MTRGADDAVILGAGLAGLAAGHALSRAGRGVTVVERGPAVGGLSRTIAHGPFRFDLGGHRFFTRDARVDSLVRGVVGPDAHVVNRRSQIRLRGRNIEYPLRAGNALAALGMGTAARIVLDRAAQAVRSRFVRREPVSLEDWVVRQFGRTLFEIYFREYSEKVWGIPCGEISAQWVAQRIQGLSFGAAVRNALFGQGRRTIRTLTDAFLYPSDGIGRIAERLADAIAVENQVRCSAEVVRVLHDERSVRAVVVRDASGVSTLGAGAVVSTVAMTDLVRMLEPRAPADVLAAVARLRFRDLVVVAVMLDRPRATDQSWMYFPEGRVPFGRIHEPTNWSLRMAPPGQTLLVAEAFCFRGDETWSSDDSTLVDRTVEALRALGIAAPREVVGSAVVRVPKAYPLFDVGYEAHRRTVLRWLGRFDNLFTAGRGGTFAYHNMDHAIASGLEAADRVLARRAASGAAAARGAEARRSA